MSNHHVNLTAEEDSLVARSHPEALERMDYSQLKELQRELRAAREKNASLLRREGAARVEAEGARGAAAPANEKRNEKLRVLDEAQHRVDDRVEAVQGSEE
ncbi:hypothetical protein [Mycolicibacterium brumae]|uniref:Uncharacterized protein n=1 Tax=Mycolicibacterium brumae TaxID=85968 RepID=A0A2G5P844_9MYCO|nr:hypothetical protein [Mycolicibacterium brumae]MCV7194799.1 hypothetical protein [Mycolicibacterium brumae]PIB74541.1 hypothetical protein CQY22_012640 [Mycolicibacterium brumae]RWA19781.1 hypothetical protein MBRU_16460 [Mycolicibacterium brumae DSM 44177]UWW09557.1 hypothetical protein L2Z93_002663 [Mycolicibacterium brumae]